MKDQKNNRSGSHAGDMNENRREQNSSTPNDLPDSKEDEKKLQTEETYMDLPDVKDIPGQEFINAPPAGILGDTTASSADEEGLSVFDRDDSDNLKRTGNDADVGRQERKALEQTDYLPTRDESNLQNARMDNVDFQNEPLNEKGFGEERSSRNPDSKKETTRSRNEEENEN